MGVMMYNQIDFQAHVLARLKAIESRLDSMSNPFGPRPETEEETKERERDLNKLIEEIGERFQKEHNVSTLP
jgi:hypothetical protein